MCIRDSLPSVRGYPDTGCLQKRLSSPVCRGIFPEAVSAGRRPVWQARTPDDPSGDLCCVIPVSYTHLDVYKRQGIITAQERKNRLLLRRVMTDAGYKPCLLYTSRCV